jgi:hypothetical protein
LPSSSGIFQSVRTASGKCAIAMSARLFRLKRSGRDSPVLPAPAMDTWRRSGLSSTRRMANAGHPFAL